MMMIESDRSRSSPPLLAQCLAHCREASHNNSRLTSVKARVRLMLPRLQCRNGMQHRAQTRGDKGAAVVAVVGVVVAAGAQGHQQQNNHVTATATTGDPRKPEMPDESK
ncbi:hypothetical protein HRR83_006882 [Exophiala dermatitidis]|uniref:Uncharacterized protein n=1 Tax=Exophiala dermatitidis TaxID=5970 RepID=A0AAN6ETR2_EXODE|nr:hypothetical protein HRR73_005922 [Exophiala dermatitidis]KAJ4512758.1 hypothetical protein HRR74_006456 [Exophiala dermatitidis]KAJ4542565.1 hypothetical protein HRR77_005762 [Exophiala dermatitidis]KAJ4548256.1 hypothetical protein HRR76_000860 [Exophiala dermatitidis]KAJ4570214.1 hypothetical protein HRR82_007425 [Exophiala dermatitidis]